MVLTAPGPRSNPSLLHVNPLLSASLFAVYFYYPGIGQVYCALTKRITEFLHTTSGTSLCLIT